MILATIQEHIEATAGVCGGKPRIAGHRIRVAGVAVLHQRLGKSAEEIADIHAALAYYFDHREEIEEDILADATFARQAESRQTSRLPAEP